VRRCVRCQDNAFGGFFLSEGDDELIEEDRAARRQVVVPRAPQTTPSAAATAPVSAPVGAATPVAHASRFSVPEVRPEPRFIGPAVSNVSQPRSMR